MSDELRKALSQFMESTERWATQDEKRAEEAADPYSRGLITGQAMAERMTVAYLKDLLGVMA